MTPEEIVTFLASAQTIEACVPDYAIAELTRSGVDPAEADRAYTMIQIAWGRHFIDGLGIQISPNFLSIDQRGRVVATGVLEQDPYFVAAKRFAEQNPTLAAIQAISQMSAEFNAVNNALLAGSKPENLVLSPAVVFEATTNARSTRPWWKFW
jgi:hypothetical protein